MPQTAVAITGDDKAIFMVVDGRSTQSVGLSGRQIRSFVKEKFTNIKYLVLVDGGGSSEMVVNGSVVNNPSDGYERPMMNGLCFYGLNVPESEPQKAILNFFDGSKDALSGISQKEGVGTHILNYANDFCGLTADDKYYLRAPYDCIIRAISEYDNTCFFESLGPVITPTGTYERCFFQTTHMHDTDLKALGLFVGRMFKQGDICYREGNKGISGGNHIHFECGTGRFNGTTMPYRDSGKTFKYEGKTYKLYVPCTNGEECHIYNMMYLNNIDTESNIKSIYSWTYASYGVIPPTVERDEFTNQVEVLVPNLRARTSPTTESKINIIGLCPMGIYNVVSSLDGWFKLGDNCYIANLEGADKYYPAIEWEQPVPVKRDKYVDQVQVNISNLRIRYEATTESRMMALAATGIYNVLAIEENEYTWYKIGNHAYIAQVDGVEYLPKYEDPTIKELEEKIKELELENEALSKRTEELESENTILEKQNSDLITEVESLSSENEEFRELTLKQSTQLDEIYSLSEDIINTYK